MEGYDDSRLERLLPDRYLLQKGRLVGFYVRLRERVHGILFLDGKRLGNLADGSSYHGTAIPSYSHHLRVALARYPARSPLPEGADFYKVEGLEYVR